MRGAFLSHRGENIFDTPVSGVVYFMWVVVMVMVRRLNTSLAAKGALAHRLQRLQNPKWPPGGPKMADGVWKGVYP